MIVLDKTFACASTGLEIKLYGKQTHAAYPENGTNPDLAVSEIINKMHEMINSEHNGIVLGTVIGIDAGSSSYGVAAGKAVIKMTLRAEYQDEYDKFVNGIEQMTAATAEKYKLKYETKRIEEFPATENYAVCTEKIKNAAEELGLKSITPSEPFRWSEDFGHYLKLTEGAFFGIGCGIDHAGLHTENYEFDDDIIMTVTDIYRELVLQMKDST